MKNHTSIRRAVIYISTCFLIFSSLLTASAANSLPKKTPLSFRTQDPLSTLERPLWKPTVLTGKYLRYTEVTMDSFEQPTVTLYFTRTGKQLFKHITARTIGKPLGIFVNGRLISAPMVQSEISEGTAVITGSFTLDQAKQLSEDLNSGLLPVPVRHLP